MPTQRILCFSSFVGLLLAAVAAGADFRGAPVGCRPEAAGCGAPECCARCRCCAPCQPKVCRVVCEMKTVTKHCWRVECEEFCAPLPGCVSWSWDLCGLFGKRAQGCQSGCCDDARCEEGCCAGTPCSVPPKCGPVRVRKKLVLEEYECQVPVYSCQVQYLCSGCADCAECVDAAPEER